MDHTASGIEVMERLVRSKYGPEERSEDQVFVSRDYVAVVDGATSKSDMVWGADSPGRVAALLVIEGLKTLSPGASFQEAVGHITSQFAEAYQRLGVMSHMLSHPWDRLAASAVIFSAFRRELWFVGDCQALVNGRFYDNPHIIDRIVSDARWAYLTAELVRGTPIESLLVSDPSKAAISPNLKMQCHYQNNVSAGPLAYSCFNGFPVEMSRTRCIPLDDNKLELVLASDGYPVLHPTLRETEERLHAILAEDPLMMGEYRNTKGRYLNQESFDDRSYIRFQVFSHP